MERTSTPLQLSDHTMLHLPASVLSLESNNSQPLTPAPNNSRKPLPPAIDQPQCLLLQLPSELRNRIWDLVLLTPTPIIKVSPTYTTPSLLNTSRQLRTEAGDLYHGSATFVLRAERGGTSASQQQSHFVHRNPSGLCVLWLATRAFGGSERVRSVCLDLYSPVRSSQQGWMEVWKPIAVQIVRDRIVALKLGDGIVVGLWSAAGV